MSVKISLDTPHDVLVARAYFEEDMCSLYGFSSFSRDSDGKYVNVQLGAAWTGFQMGIIRAEGGIPQPKGN